MQFLIKKFEREITGYKGFEDKCRDLERDNGTMLK